jgi:hypothetical protein
MIEKTENMPPFTLQDAENELLVAMNMATDTRDLLSATHLLLFNLLMHLDQQGIINGPGFISGLLVNCVQLPAANERSAAEVVCNDLMQRMLAYRLQSGDHAH